MAKQPMQSAPKPQGTWQKGQKAPELKDLVGQRVTIWCLNYIYTGDLIDVNENTAVLDQAGIVYETGGFQDPNWKDYQPLPHPVFVMMRTVESFMILK